MTRLPDQKPGKVTFLPARMVVVALTYVAAGVLVLDTMFARQVLVGPWTRVNAAVAASLTSVLGVETVRVGTEVRSGLVTLDILNGCNGVQALLILVCGMLAFPARWSWRLLGVLAGAVVLFGVNVVRLVNLIVVARYYPGRLELFHIYIWQALIILIAFALFLVWGSLARGWNRAATIDAG